MLDFNVDENYKPVDNDDEIVKEGMKRVGCIWLVFLMHLNIQ
jgi:hypothetical protein